jgi:predicted phosphodiesterase
METKKLEKLVNATELTDKEIEILLKSKKPTLRKTQRFDMGKGDILVGVVSDQHYGSAYSSEKAHDASVQVFKSEKPDFLLMPGDFIEGMSGREGHVYELSDIGITSQLRTAVDRLNQYGLPIYGITGNHDGWAKTKADMGLEVGPELEARVKDFSFLGEYEGEVQLNPNITIKLSHRGNSAYALSYSGQKRLNAYEGGTKPDIEFNGHIQKAMYMF